MFALVKCEDKKISGQHAFSRQFILLQSGACKVRDDLPHDIFVAQAVLHDNARIAYVFSLVKSENIHGNWLFNRTKTVCPLSILHYASYLVKHETFGFLSWFDIERVWDVLSSSIGDNAVLDEILRIARLALIYSIILPPA